MDPLFSFLIGHLIGDYALQSERMAQNKRNLGGYLIFHVTIYSFSIAFFSWVHDVFYDPDILSAVLPWIVPIFVIHLLQDFAKSRFYNSSRQFYYLDQALHLITLYLLRIIVGG